jgi:seryl-tRNA synthetase
MLQVNYIRQNRQEVIEKLRVKNFDAAEIIDALLRFDDERRKTQKQLDDILSESNKTAREIGGLYKAGKREEAEKLKARSAELKQLSKSLGEQLEAAASGMNEQLLKLPNVPHPSVNPGTSEDDNEVLHQEGELTTLGEGAVPHWDLINTYDIIDFDLGNKVSGAGFPFYKGKGAKLQRALINFFLDRALDAGYIEFQPPLLVNEDSGYGTGQLPDKDGQMYHVTEDNLYLVPTAEVPITNIYRNMILKEGDLPIKNVAYSSCFRREAGSWGAHVRGLNRLHQFDKVEIVHIATPDSSYTVLEEMRAHVTSLIRDLELPFRILRLCGGDLSFTSALTYDFEVYAAAQKRWLEVSSVSNFESFQANRMKLRYKDENGSTVIAHTLNGSALALPRIVAALLENNQGPDGIRIPKVLVPYTGFETID